MADRIPAWAAAPRPAHSRVLLLTADRPDAGDESLESWTVDDKAAYLLGRNGQAVDICVPHKSSSRVHACLAYDAENLLYLVDLGSAHGAHIE